MALPAPRFGTAISNSKATPTITTRGQIAFNRYRKKKGVPYSYTRCECPFGFSYITDVRQLSDTPGKESAWDTAPQTRTQRKVERFVLIFVGVTIVLAALVVGLAVLLSDK